MSVYITSRVWRGSSAGGSALLVLLALADQADDDGWCFPGVPYLAAKCRLAERTVQENIARLEKAGEVQRHARAGRSNYYRVTVPDTPPDRTPAKSAPPRPTAPHPRGEPHPTPAGDRTHNHQGTINETPAEPAGSAAGALPGMPEAPERWNGGVVVAAWVRGYREAHDTDPVPGLLNRVRSSAKHAAMDAPETQHDAILAVAAAAGRLGRYDVVQAIADAGAGRMPVNVQGRPALGASPSSRNASILARASERWTEGGAGDGAE